MQYDVKKISITKNRKNYRNEMTLTQEDDINPVNEKESTQKGKENSVNENNPVNEITNEPFINDLNKSTVTENESNFRNETTFATALNTEMLVDEFNTIDRLDKKFITTQLRYIPYTIRIIVKNTYNRFSKLNKKGLFHANSYLREIGNYCKSLPIDVTWSESNIKLVSKRNAYMCYQYSYSLLEEGKEPSEVLIAVEAILLQHNLPARKGNNIQGDIARYCCEKWWFKKLSKLQAVTLETLAQYLRIVSKQSQIYLSDATFQKGRENKRRNQVFLSTLEAVNEKGDCVDLKTLADSNTSNPVNRRNELMIRLHGCEVYGNKHGYVADFLTITCPSKMHAVHNNGKPNDNYDGTTPKQANQYLCAQWAKQRAQLARDNIDYYGFRVAEPHHDGTPHWHILIFVKPEQRESMRNTIREYALQVDGDERGAQKYRFKVDPIIKSKGSAVGYIAKYISKNIDGFGLDSDEHGNPAKNSALRVCEWSSIWGIRQFQQFGGPPVTLWREARRLALKEEVNITPVWVAADKGDWCEFIEALGGINVARKDLPVTLVKEFIEIEGEYWEPIGYVIVGLGCGGEIYSSREHTWTVRKKESVVSLSLGENEV